MYVHSAQCSALKEIVLQCGQMSHFTKYREGSCRRGGNGPEGGCPELVYQ